MSPFANILRGILRLFTGLFAVSGIGFLLSDLAGLFSGGRFAFTPVAQALFWTIGVQAAYVSLPSFLLALGNLAPLAPTLLFLAWICSKCSALLEKPS